MQAPQIAGSYEEVLVSYFRNTEPHKNVYMINYPDSRKSDIESFIQKQCNDNTSVVFIKTTAKLFKLTGLLKNSNPNNTTPNILGLHVILSNKIAGTNEINTLFDYGCDVFVFNAVATQFKPGNYTVQYHSINQEGSYITTDPTSIDDIISLSGVRDEKVEL